MERYVLIDVGCLECGNPTEMIGTYATIDEAKAAAQTTLDAAFAAANERNGTHWSRALVWDDTPDHHSWRGDGVHAIFDGDTSTLMAVTL